MSENLASYSEVKHHPRNKQIQGGKKTEQLVYSEVRFHPSHSNQSKKTETESSKGKGSSVPFAWYLAVVILGTLCLILIVATGVLGMKVLQDCHRGELQNLPLVNVTGDKCATKNMALKEEPLKKGHERNMCKANWRCCGEKCYYISSDLKSFEESKKFCKEKGSTLLKIEDEEELKFIQSQIFYFHWIGLSREGTRSPWTWEDKSSSILKIFSDWREPMNGNCARITKTGMFPSDCSRVVKFICERKMTSLLI